MEKTFKQQLNLARKEGLSVFDLRVGLEVEDQLTDAGALAYIDDGTFNAICWKVAQVFLKSKDIFLEDVVEDLIDKIVDILDGKKPTKEDIRDIINNIE